MKAARMIVAGAMVAGLAAIAWLLRPGIDQASGVADPLPCSPSVLTIDAWRQGSFVFEGIVIDQRPRTFAYDGRIVTVRSPRFYVVRSWRKLARPEVELSQGWYDGSPSMRGTYRTFVHGGRYLVFAISHDMPPSTFTTSCMPGAEGADIAALAAQLGPPVTTFPEEGRPRLTFWRPFAWSALDAVNRVMLAIDPPAGSGAAPRR